MNGNCWREQRGLNPCSGECFLACRQVSAGCNESKPAEPKIELVTVDPIQRPDKVE